MDPEGVSLLSLNGNWTHWTAMKPFRSDLCALLELRIHPTQAAQRDVKGRLQSVHPVRFVHHTRIVPVTRVISRAGWDRCCVYGCPGSDAQHCVAVSAALFSSLCGWSSGTEQSGLFHGCWDYSHIMLGRRSFPAGSVLGLLILMWKAGSAINGQSCGWDWVKLEWQEWTYLKSSDPNSELWDLLQAFD